MYLHAKNRPSDALRVCYRRQHRRYQAKVRLGVKELGIGTQGWVGELASSAWALLEEGRLQRGVLQICVEFAIVLLNKILKKNLQKSSLLEIFHGVGEIQTKPYTYLRRFSKQNLNHAPSEKKWNPLTSSYHVIISKVNLCFSHPQRITFCDSKTQ